MRVEKRVLNDALRVLGKVVCQTSPVELYRSVRFVGDGDGVMAMVTDGVETVSVTVSISPCPFVQSIKIPFNLNRRKRKWKLKTMLWSRLLPQHSHKTPQNFPGLRLSTIPAVQLTVTGTLTFSARNFRNSSTFSGGGEAEEYAGSLSSRLILASPRG